MRRKTRRPLAFLLAAVMTMGLGITASASSTTPPTHDVTGTYAGNTGTPVYSFRYQWGDMKFKYSGGGQGTWNPATHSYTGEADAGGWTAVGGSDEITVWNDSNAEVQVTLTFAPAKSGIKFGFGEPRFTLASAVGTTKENAPSKTTFVGPMDDSAGLSAGDTDVKLGTVTLTVNPV